MLDEAVRVMELLIVLLVAAASLLSWLLPAVGLLALVVLAQTWKDPELRRSGPFWYAYRISRYYVFAALLIALLWLLAAVFVINTDFWTEYDPDANPDPLPALEHAIEHWDDV